MNRNDRKTVIPANIFSTKFAAWRLFERIQRRRTRSATTRCLFAGFFVFAGFFPAMAAAQSASGSPVKWPDQAECRTLLSAGEIIGEKAADNLVKAGWCVAIDDRRGNCVACHAFNVSPWPVSLPIAGNLAPPMVAMRARFPDSAALRGIIEDVTTVNPRSSMPPYLKHGILTAQEIDQLIAFLGTL